MRQNQKNVLMIAITAAVTISWPMIIVSTSIPVSVSIMAAVAASAVIIVSTTGTPWFCDAPAQ